MTDLPRFYQGEFGKLDFTTMNEMMKRLDLLLPLVQNAAGGGGWTGIEKPMVFPVYAERTDEKTELEHYKYKWWEVTLVDHALAWDDQILVDPGATQLRSGQEAVLPIHPREDSEELESFLEGFAIAIGIRSANVDATVGGVQYLIFPMSPGSSGPGYVLITEGDPLVGTVAIGTDSRSVTEYPAKYLRPSPGEEGASGMQVVEEEVIAVDLNASETNRPTITGADTFLEPRFYDPGTIFMATKIGTGKYAFTHLVRFDVTCS